LEDSVNLADVEQEVPSWTYAATSLATNPRQEQKWKEAIEAEWISLVKYDTFEIVAKPNYVKMGV
jgi:hypothetical protein